MIKNLYKTNEKVDFLKNFKRKHTFPLNSSARPRENVSCNALLADVPLLVLELLPKNRRAKR